MPRATNVPHVPSARLEDSLASRGYAIVAGIDEVGRGPLAGPVLAAAVVLRPGSSHELHGFVQDSKQLTPRAREEAYGRILAAARAHAVGACDAALIDRAGIVGATRLAMMRAIESLDMQPDHLLIDALDLPELDISQTALIKGDARCLSIAAASIVAKVTRDRLMETVFEVRYPGYGFASHKGYGTHAHLEALRRLGPSPIHRRSFAPVRQLTRRPNTTTRKR